MSSLPDGERERDRQLYDVRFSVKRKTAPSYWIMQSVHRRQPCASKVR